MKYDVAIIGGGPAGVSLALHLLSKGHTCCIIDKEIFPREKLCAGVLTFKTQNILDEIAPELAWENIPNRVTDLLEIYNKNKLVGKYNLSYCYKIVDRKYFDYEFIKCFLSKGGKLFESVHNYKIDYNNNKINISDNILIEYTFLVGADGINSKVRNYVSPKYKPQALCMATYVQNVSHNNTVKVYFGEINGGYRWLIPCTDIESIGAAGNVKKCNKYFKEMCQKTTINFRGHLLSDGKYVKKPINKNVLLVGDAAGLVDSISGEGIYFALLSGKIAANSIDEFFKNPFKEINYLPKIHTIHNLMKHQLKFKKLLYSRFIRDITMFIVKKNPKWAVFIFDEIISSYNQKYWSAIKYFIKMR